MIYKSTQLLLDYYIWLIQFPLFSLYSGADTEQFAVKGQKHV